MLSRLALLCRENTILLLIVFYVFGFVLVQVKCWLLTLKRLSEKIQKLSDSVSQVLLTQICYSIGIKITDHLEQIKTTFAQLSSK